MAKLTDKTVYSGTLNDSDLIHVVDVSDTTQDPAGSSYKLTLVYLYNWILSKLSTVYESLSNKATTSVGNETSDTKYLTAKAVVDLVNSNVSASTTFMFANIAHAIGGGYLQAVTLPNFTAGAIATPSQSVTTTPTLMATFATNTGYPNTTILPIGTIAGHYETTKSAGANNYYSYFEIYKRVLAGTETLLATSDITTQTSVNTIVQNYPSVVLTAPVTLLTTDLIVIKVYCVMLSSSATISIGFDDNTNSRFTLPAINVDLSGYFNKSTDDTDDITEGATKKFNATHTGEVTGATALTLDKTAITNKTLVTADASDHVLIADASDTGNLKKVLVSDFGGASALIVTNRQTASYSLVLTDATKLVEMNVATANNCTIPLNATQAFPIGTQILVDQTGAGQTTLVATGGVTLNYTDTLKTRVQNSTLCLIKIGTDEWDVSGDTEPLIPAIVQADLDNAMKIDFKYDYAQARGALFL